MRVFDQWLEAFIIVCIMSVIIAIPCFLTVLVGRKMINRIGQYPTQAPTIQMSIWLQLVAIEAVGFLLLIMFYNFFSD